MEETSAPYKKMEEDKNKEKIEAELTKIQSKDQDKEIEDSFSQIVNVEQIDLEQINILNEISREEKFKNYIDWYLNAKLENQIEKRNEIDTLEKHTDYITSLAVFKNGTQLVSGSADKHVYKWDLATAECIKIGEHKDIVTNVDIVTKSEEIASAGKDNMLYIWDRNYKKRVSRVNIISMCSFFKLTKEYIVLCYDLCHFLIIDFKTNKDKRIYAHKAAITSIAFSRNGKKIITGSLDRTIIVYNIFRLLESKDKEQEKAKHYLTGHDDYITCVLLNKSGTKAFSSSADCTIRIWNPDSEKEILKIEGHEEVVNNIVLTKDEKLLVSGSSDMTMRVWNAESGEIMYKFRFETEITCVAISKDKKRIFAGGMDNNIHITNLLFYESFVNLKSIIKIFEENPNFNLLKIALPKEEFYMSVNIYPYNVIYPYDNSLFHYFAKSKSKLENLIKLCIDYKIYPTISYQKNSLKQTPLDIALEEPPNFSAIEILAKYYIEYCVDFKMDDVISVKLLATLVSQENLSNFVITILNSKLENPEINLDQVEWIFEEKEKVYLSLNHLYPSENVFESFLVKQKPSQTHNRLIKLLLRIFNFFLLILSKLNNIFLLIEEIPPYKVYPVIRRLNIKKVLQIPESSDEDSLMGKCSDLRHSHPIFENDIFEDIIHFKWDFYGKFEFFKISLRYLFLMSLITANSVFILPNRIKKDTKELLRISFVMNCVIGPFLIFFFIMEIYQIYVLKWKNYFSDSWNKMDLLIIIFGLFLTVIDILSIFHIFKDENTLKLLHSLVTLLVWLRILNIFRGFRSTSFMVRSLFEIFIDIKAFILVLLLFLIALGFSAYVIQTDDYAVGKWGSFQAYYGVVLGDFEKFNSMQSKNIFALWVIFFISTVVITIILSNLLITLVGRTFDRISEKERSASNSEKTQIIYEIEKMMSQKKRDHINSLIGNYLYIIYREDPNEAEEDQMEIIKDIQKKAETLEEKLDSSIEMLSTIMNNNNK